jgi:hypothetical protein
MSSMRPPMLAGPMERKRKFASRGFVERLIIVAVSRRAVLPWAAANVTGTLAMVATMDTIKKNRLGTCTAVELQEGR